jgi:hypothetical protein
VTSGNALAKQTTSRLIGAAVLIGCACGYRFSAAGGPLPKGVQSVYVPVFRNRTTEAGLESLLTEELRADLEKAGHGGSPSSEARLEGVIEGVGAIPLALKSAPLPTSGGGGGLAPYNPGLYQVSFAVTVKLMRGTELLAEIDHLSLNEPYLPADDLATNEANRRLALRRLARSMARELVDRLTVF